MKLFQESPDIPQKQKRNQGRLKEANKQSDRQKKKPTAQRLEMVIGILALLWDPMMGDVDVDGEKGKY